MSRRRDRFDTWPNIGQGSVMQLNAMSRAISVLVPALVFAACSRSEPARQTPQSTSTSTVSEQQGAPPAGVRTFVIVPAESKASYHADEQLFSLAFEKFGLPAGWAKVVGSTQA